MDPQKEEVVVTEYAEVIPNDAELGGSRRHKKNMKAKTHKKKGNKVLAAWREHVKAVAAAEGMTYGKEAMQMAKKGKHGQEWAKIKASIQSKKGGAHFNTAGEMVPTDEGEEGSEGVNSEMPVQEAQLVTPNDENLPVSNETAQLSGGRRSRKNKGRKSRKSRKHRRSRKH
jgi:hypothetical protein